MRSRGPAAKTRMSGSPGLRVRLDLLRNYSPSMPGLVGFVQEISRESSSDLLARMARALEADARFRAQLHAEDGFGLGRVSLELLNSDPQPVWNEDRSLALVMEGEIFGGGDLVAWLRERGHHLGIGNDAELVLHLYEELGSEFAASLNGAFVIALWDQRSRRLIVANDRLGLVPLYYARARDGFLFASGVRALLADPSLSRQVDRVAIAEFLTFDHVLGPRTLLTDVRLLPQASVLTYSSGRLKIRPYWRPQYLDTVPYRDEGEVIDDLLFHLRQGIRRMVARDDQPLGLLLSGGLDSRFVLGLLCEAGAAARLTTFTWGQKGCDDERYARAASHKAGVRHRFYGLQPHWLLDKGTDGVRMTDGLANIVNLHALANIEAQSREAKIVYKGFMGDALLGHSVELPFWGDYEERDRIKANLQSYVGIGAITFLPTEQEALFTDSFQRSVGGSVLAELGNAMMASGCRQLANQRLYVDLTQRVPRMTIHGVQVMRSQVLVRVPFCDNDLVQFTMGIPPGLLHDRQLSVNAFIRAFPHLAKVPYTKTGLPMVSCAHEVLLRAERLAGWHLRHHGLGAIAGPERRPYQRYDLWFRGVLRPFVEETLLTSRALDRGYFKADEVRRIVAEHMAGTNHTVKLGALLSIELWHRMCID